MTSETSSPVPRLQLALCAVLFSTGGAAIKACSLGAWEVAGLRSGIAALTLVLLIPAARRAWTRWTIPVGVVYAATLVTYVSANKYTTAANAIFLQSSAPLYIVLLGPWLIGERARRGDLVLLALVGAGLWMLLGSRTPAYATAPDPAFGNLLGAAAGVFWGLTLLGLRRLGRDRPGAPIAAAAAGNALAFLGCLPFALRAGDLATASGADWLVLVYLGVVQIGLAYVLMGLAVQRVSAFEASLILMLEPALSPFWAWWIHGEVPGALQLAGGATIVAAGLVKSLLALRARPVRSAA